MRLRALFTLTAAFSFAACFSFSDLSGGGDDSVAGDSGGDAAATDAQSGDASSPDDGSVSTTDGAPFCLGELDATFCADFDESTDAVSGFTSLYASDGGIYGLDETEFVSGPRAFFSGNAALGVGASAHSAIVRRTAIKPTSSILLDLDMRIDSLSSQNSPLEALAIVNESATRSSLQMNLKSLSSEVGEEVIGLDGGQTYSQHLFPKAVPVGRFVHVHIAIQFGPSNRTLTVFVAGETMVDHVNMSQAFVFGPVDLYLGNAYSPGPSDGSTIHYDNVSLTVE